MSRWRVLARWLGDQIVGVLLAFGWQPKQERDGKKPPDVS